MPESFLGLPIHPLVVHATVVIVPTAAALLVATVLLPRLRAWAGPLPLLLAVVALVLTPISTASGKNFAKSFGESAAIERHQDLGEMLIWWTLGLVVVAGGVWLLERRGQLGGGIAVALKVAAVLVGLGTIVQVALIGHSGAEAAWG